MKNTFCLSMLLVFVAEIGLACPERPILFKYTDEKVQKDFLGRSGQTEVRVSAFGGGKYVLKVIDAEYTLRFKQRNADEYGNWCVTPPGGTEVCTSGPDKDANGKVISPVALEALKNSKNEKSVTDPSLLLADYNPAFDDAPLVFLRDLKGRVIGALQMGATKGRNRGFKEKGVQVLEPRGDGTFAPKGIFPDQVNGGARIVGYVFNQPITLPHADTLLNVLLGGANDPKANPMDLPLVKKMDRIHVDYLFRPVQFGDGGGMYVLKDQGNEGTHSTLPLKKSAVFHATQIRVFAGIGEGVFRGALNIYNLETNFTEATDWERKEPVNVSLKAPGKGNDLLISTSVLFLDGCKETTWTGRQEFDRDPNEREL